MVALAIVAVLRTVELMGLLCQGDPENCKLGDHFGYQHCACRSGSLTSAIHDRLVQGVTVVLAPNTTLEGAEEAARRFLEEVIQLPDGNEYHSIKNDDAIVYTAIKLLKRRRPPDPVRRVLRDMIVFFASATPITNDVGKSLDVPLKFIIPEAWNDRKHEKHATLSRAWFKELVIATQRGNDTGIDRIFEAWKNYLAGFMIRRMVQSGFLGEPECPLPRYDITKIDCSWNSLGSSERQEFASIVQLAKKSAGGGEYNSDSSSPYPFGPVTAVLDYPGEPIEFPADRNEPILSDRADVATVFSRLALSDGFLSQLYGATFVHPFRLREAGVGKKTLAVINGPDGWQQWITAEHANNANYLTPGGRSQHPAMRSGAIDFLCKGSSKFAEIEKILAKAKADDSGPAEGFDYPRGVKGWEGIDQSIKKSVVLFCSRPGVAVLLALYADKHWSRDWNVHLLTSASKDRQQTIDGALRPVVFNDSTKKPSILIGAMSICGEGVNGMQNACYSVSVDLPFSEALRAQVRGRVFRYGQIHFSEHFELVSQHPAERIILARHRERYTEIQGTLEELEAGSGGRSGGLGPAAA
ncbi:hypothetical protein C8A03DRAFT_38395 [Achaetomium macrosporum]|uniref:Helicase C-terminal domain-containing protein n=1 Tax=Achaetomium macrosporum TaxID=79813 RepID=A0AAN7C1Y8_9PEZI|nr:hypothetical protein C8A03DRAFT_38395 [Achaetomium macrosporum]